MNRSSVDLGGYLSIKRSKGTNNQYINDSQVYAELSNLLSIPRSNRDKKRVLSVIEEDISLRDKIKKIKQIDKQSVFNKAEAKMKNYGDQQKKAISAYKQASKVKPKKDVPVLFEHPAPLEKNNFLSYTFGHFRKISRFGRASKAIKIRYFPPRHELHNRFYSLICDDLRTEIVPLLEPLWNIREDGWKILTKLEYNLCVHFYDIIDLYYKKVTAGFVGVENLLLIQNPFIQLIQNTHYMDTLLEAIDKYISEPTPYIKDKKIILHNTQRIIHPTKMKPSLTEAILAVNMIQSKKYITLEELFKKQKIGYISAKQYQCPEHVKTRLDQYKRIISNKYLNALDEKDFIVHLKKSVLEPDGETKKPFKILYEVYHYYANLEINPEKHLSFDDALNKDVKDWLVKILNNFGDIFDPLMGKNVKVKDQDENYEEIALFPYKTLDIYDRFRNVSLKISHFADKYPKIKIPYDSYNRALNYTLKDEESNTRFVRLVKDLSFDAFELGRNIYNLLINREHILGMGYQEKLNFLRKRDLAEMTLSHPDHFIVNSRWFAEKSVIQVAYTMMDTLLSLSYLLKENLLMDLLKQDEILLEEIKKYEEILHRMA